MRWLALLLIIGNCAAPSVPVVSSSQDPGYQATRLCEPPIDVGVGPLRHATFSSIVQNAVTYWNSAIGAPVLLVQRTYKDPRVSVATVTPGKATAHELAQPLDVRHNLYSSDEIVRAHIYRHDSGCIVGAVLLVHVDAAEVLSLRVVESAVRHALGYVLGLGHSPVEYTVMHPTQARAFFHPLVADRGSVEQLKRAYHIR